MHRVLATLLFLLVAAPTTAQIQLTVSGRVVPAPAGACNPAATHAIACSEVLLQSTVVDLTQFEGQTVQVQGTPQIAIGCLTLDVTAVESTGGIRLSAFSLSNFRIGTTMTLLSQAPLGSIMVQFFADDSGFLPLGPLGSYLLEFQSTLQWELQIGIGLPFPRFIQVPNNPGIIGCRPHFQFFAVDLTSPLDSRFSNSICFEIRG